MNEPKKYDYIDALRGYAILLVILTHASQAGPAMNPVLMRLFDQGARGVVLFFVVSALTLSLSWYARQGDAKTFYIRRLFRIAPMFWLVMIVYFSMDGYAPRYYAPNGVGLFHILLTASFLHGWHPETINSIVPGDWSVANEMVFYLAFPFLIAIIRGWKSAVAAFVVAVYLASFVNDLSWAHRANIWPGQPDGLVDILLKLWLPAYVPSFMVGFILFFSVRRYSGRLPLRTVRLLLFAAIAAMFALALHPGADIGIAPLKLHFSIFTSYAVCFGIFSFCLAEGAARSLVNGPIRHLGKISFSAYLLHWVVISGNHSLSLSGINMFMTGGYGPVHGFWFFLHYFLCLLASTVLLSTITYRYIEKPMIAAGNRYLTSRATPVAQATA
ncbi:MAG: hypothetical protein JWR22_1352 [Herminiimonas sp.]|nr:hypothetical protein [Herminiimonas sp.]